MRMWEYIDEHFQITHKFSSFSTLIKLAFMILLIGHISCCIFVLIGENGLKNGDRTWLDDYKVTDSDP